MATGREWLVGVLMLLVIISAIVGTWGSVTRHNKVDKSFCKLDTAIVRILQQSIANVTPAKAKAHIIEYERARISYAEFIGSIVKIAPCKINGAIPPDVAKP